MTVYMVNSLPKIPYTHRIYIYHIWFWPALVINRKRVWRIQKHGLLRRCPRLRLHKVSNKGSFTPCCMSKCHEPVVRYICSMCCSAYFTSFGLCPKHISSRQQIYTCDHSTLLFTTVHKECSQSYIMCLEEETELTGKLNQITPINNKAHVKRIYLLQLIKLGLACALAERQVGVKTCDSTFWVAVQIITHWKALLP